jgi:hypothetical protein
MTVIHMSLWGSTSSNTIEMLGTRGQIYASGAMIKSITPSPREGIGVTGRRPGPELNPLKGDVAQLPLVPRWLLIVIDINLFVLLCFLIHRVFSPVASRDFHLPQRDLGISMGSLVAVEPSGTSMLGSPKPFWAEPSSRASVSGAPKVIASRGIPRSSRDIDCH